MSFPFSSLTAIVFCCSGLMTSAIFMTGFSSVFLSSIITGMTPYMRMGKSLMVCACGCNRLTFTYTLGAIPLSALKLNFVCPGFVSVQYVFNTLLPLSMLIKALPPLLVGMVNWTSSPTLYACLSAVNDSMEAAVGSSLLSWFCQYGSST